MAFHCIYAMWHYEHPWTWALTGLLWYACDYLYVILYIILHFATLHNLHPVTHTEPGKCICHPHCNSAWQRTERWLVHGDAGIMKTDWAMGSYGDTGETEIAWVTGSIYLGTPGVDSHHLIFWYTELHTVYFTAVALTGTFWDCVYPYTWGESSWPGSITSSHPHSMILEPELLFLRTIFWMLRVVRRTVDKEVSAF